MSQPDRIIPGGAPAHCRARAQGLAPRTLAALALALALAPAAAGLRASAAFAAVDREDWNPAMDPARHAALLARLGGGPLPLPADAAREAAGLRAGVGPYGPDAATGLSPAAEPPSPSTDAVYGWDVVPPPARWVHSTIYDPVRDRLVVFGGQGYSGSSGEVWALALSGIPHWQQILPSGTGPVARAFHSAIYDSLRDRMLVFGGTDENGAPSNVVWSLAFGGNPTWSQLATTGTPPSARQWQVAVYDRARDRMLVMGGQNGTGTLSDVWALTLSGTPTWSQLQPAANPSPGARTAGCGVYDAINDRLVIFGGLDGNGLPVNQAWALTLSGTPTWSPIAGAGTPPSPRFGTSALYDRIRNRLVLFAGGTGAPNLNDLWTLSLGATPTWTHLTPTNVPEGRQFHTACYDPVGDCMLVFGGSSGPILSDTWSLALDSPSQWIPLSCTRRRGHTALYDPARNRMDVFGGEDDALYNDVWDLPLGGTLAWEKLAPLGTPPSARTLFGSAYDTQRDRMIVFGGRDVTQLNDAWELTFSGELTWNLLAPAGTPPSPREDCASAYDSGHGRMIVFGGADASGVYNDAWTLALVGAPTWTKLAPTGTAPAARGGATVIYDPLRDRLIVWGGYDKNFNALGDLYALSLGASPAWTKLTLSGTPPAPRFASAAIYDPPRDRFLFHGGTDFSAYFGDTWAVSLGAASLAWSPLGFQGALPPSRSDHKAVYDAVSDRMLFFGGENAVGVLHDAWVLSFANTVDARPAPVAARLALGAARPNPARAGDGAAFRLDLPEAAGQIDLSVFDVRGRKVAEVVHGALGPGAHDLRWDGRVEGGGPAPAGVYFARAAWGRESVTRKVVIAR